MEQRIQSVGWSDHATARLKQRLNAEPADVTDLLIGRVPVTLANSVTNPGSVCRNRGYAVDVPHVCRFVVNPDADPKRRGRWVVVTVLDWEQRKGRGASRRAPTGRAKGKRKRFDLTDEDLQWIEQR